MRIELSEIVGRFAVRAKALGAALAMALVPQNALAIDANDVLTKMSRDHRIGYINGVVEGLTFARWLKDRPDTTGVKCIHNWYYGDPAKSGKVTLQWLERNPDKTVGLLMHALIKKECGA